MIQAIIFDFGRVISAQKPSALFRRYEDELGLKPGTINSIMFDSEAWHEALVGRKTAEEFWHEIGPELGLNSVDEVDAFRYRYRADEEINQGVLDLISRLHGNYKLAVLSNSPPGLSQWLADWNVLNFFDVVFCSGDEGIAKPDLRAFELTLERLGLKPNEAAFIDDTSEHVEAARKLGLQGILFTTAEALEKELNLLLSKIH
jgi:putative hydrolase of the HAD superfamily